MPSNLLTPEMFANFDLFTLFKPVAGLYLLIWCAILGKGKLLRHEHLKCSEEVFRRNMRILCAVSGVILIFSGVVDIIGDIAPGAFIDPASVLGWIIWGVGLAALISVMVYSIVMTDHSAARKAQKEAAEKEQAAARSVKFPSSAFDFEDDKRKK